MTYAKKTLSEIKLIHGNYGNFIKGQKLPNTKEKKYKEPPYKDLAASNEIDGETLNEKCWPGYEKKGMKTMFGKRYPNCVKKKKTKKEEFSDWRSELEQIEEKKMTKAQIKKRDEIADAISTKDMKDRYGDKNVKYAIATKLAMKEGVGSVVKGGLKLGSKLLKKSAPFMGGATVGGTIGYETGKEKEREKTDAMMRSAYQDQGMLLQTNSDLRKQIKDLKKKSVKEDNIQEILDKKDVPHVKKLVGKLRKGSKTHAKQADDLEKAMNEDALDENLRPLVKGFTHFARKLAKQRTKIPYFQLNRPDLTYVPKKSKLAQYAMYHGTSKKSADKIIKSGKFKKSVGDVLNPDGTVFDSKRAFATTNPKRAKFYANMAARRDGSKPEILAVKVRDSNIYNPASIPNEYYIKTKHMKPVGRGVKPIKIKKGQVMQNSFNPLEENSVIESELVIQDWNKDDIKFTEIETVDIIKAKPLKENVDLEEGVKRKLVKKLINKAIKKISKGGKSSKYSVDKALSKKVQLQSIKNQANYPSQLGRQINKGTTPVKVDVSKPINFDKYFGGSPPTVKKKFGSQKPTGTFIDDLPPPEAKPLSKTQKKLMKKLDKQQMKDIENDPMSKVIKKQIEKETGTKTRKFSQKGGVTKGNENEILSNVKPKPKKPLKDHFDWRNELDEDWQKVNRKDKTDGLSKAAVKAYRRENPGSKLQTAVTKDPKKLKKGSKSAKRRLSFCRRMKGMKKKLTSAKTRRDPDSRINKALRRWNC